MSTLLEFGLDTFGDITKDAAGTLLPQAQVIRNVIDEAVLADELEIDFIGLGEHHRLCYLLARGGAGGDRRTHQADPAGLCGDRAEFGRSHSRVPALRHGRRRVERPC